MYTFKNKLFVELSRISYFFYWRVRLRLRWRWQQNRLCYTYKVIFNACWKLVRFSFAKDFSYGKLREVYSYELYWEKILDRFYLNNRCLLCATYIRHSTVSLHKITMNPMHWLSGKILSTISYKIFYTTNYKNTGYCTKLLHKI